MPVAISKTYEELESFQTDRDAHDYFVRKFLEGFRKIDDHFSTTLESHLTPLLEEKYKRELFYEKKMAGKRIGVKRVQVIGRYLRDTFKLFVNVYEKNELLASHLAYENEPDFFLVKYDIAKVEFSDDTITVINKIRENTLVLDFADITP